jgi:hypothetical protein
MTLDKVQGTLKALGAKNPFWENPKTIYSGAIIRLKKLKGRAGDEKLIFFHHF